MAQSLQRAGPLLQGERISPESWEGEGRGGGGLGWEREIVLPD